MDYTLHQLRVFLKVAELESITKAAEELYLTQPAVSIQLKNFQDQFEVPLTEVIGRKLYVTDFGKEIALAAEKIILEVEKINYRTMTYKNQLAGKLKVSSASTGKYVMPYFLSDFIQQNQGVDLVMDVTNKTTVVKQLENNEVDFALVSVIPDALKTISLPLLENKLYLVGGAGSTNQKKSLQKRLDVKPLIYREPGSATRLAMEAFLKKKNIPTTNKMELTSNEAVKQALIAGLGYSIMPLIGLRNEINNGQLEIIPTQGLPVTTQWNLVWMKSKELSPVADAFLNYLLEEKDRLIDQYFSWRLDF